VIGVAGHGCIAAATAADTEILPRILDFFEELASGASLPRSSAPSSSERHPRPLTDGELAGIN